MKRLICLIAVLLWGAVSFAQESKIPVILEIVELESDDDTELVIFNMPKDSTNHYYFCVGSMAMGDDIIQVHLDPVSQLFLPLGDTLEEAIQTLEELKGLFKLPKGSAIQKPGCLAVGFPNGQLEAVTVTHRNPFLSHRLEFSLERDGYIRSAYVSKSELSSLLSSVKFHRRLHPNE